MSCFRWSGGMPNPFGSSTQNNYIYSIYATYYPTELGTSTVGNTTVFGTTTTTANRRAMPFTMPQGGTIESISIYHEGGTGEMLLGGYDGDSLPLTRLAVTPTTSANQSAGWQTIDIGRAHACAAVATI